VDVWCLLVEEPAQWLNGDFKFDADGKDALARLKAFVWAGLTDDGHQEYNNKPKHSIFNQQLNKWTHHSRGIVVCKTSKFRA
jgi:hypothetical protein